MFQRTSQDPKSTCYYLVLKYYFTSEQLKVFKENPCSLNTYLHAERGKELLDSENASFQHRSAALKCRTEWYADCIQVCIYFFAIDNRRRPFLQLLWIWWVRLCYSYIHIYIYIYIYIYILLTSATAKEREVLYMRTNFYHASRITAPEFCHKHAFTDAVCSQWDPH